MNALNTLDVMCKEASRTDDHFAKVMNGDYNFSNKQKIITGAGAAAGGIGLGLLQNHAINKQIKNAQRKQETARTDASRMRWEKVEDSLKKHKKGRVAGSAIYGTLAGAAIPYSVFSSRNEARRVSDYRKAYDADWDDFQKEWDKTWEAYKNAYNGGSNRNWYSGGSSSYTKARDASGDFSAFGINKDQFKTKADFNKWYKSQAKKYHPDINPDGADMMKKVNNFADNVRKSDWFSKLAFMLAQRNMEKQASIGTVLSAGAKFGSKLLSSSTGKAMLSSAGRGAMQGAIMGAASSQPGQDGKNHWIKNGLQGAAMGAGIGAAGAGIQKAIPRMPEFGAKIKSSFQSTPSAPGATTPPVQKPASTTI